MSIKKKAFTLIEMLIVVVIIGILAAALIPRLQGVQGRARDTQRKTDLGQIGNAAAVLQSDIGTYSWPTAAVNSGTINKSVLMPTYMSNVPEETQKNRVALTELWASAQANMYAGNAYGSPYQILVLGANTEVAGTSNAQAGTWTSVSTMSGAQAMLSTGGALRNVAEGNLRYYYIQ